MLFVLLCLPILQISSSAHFDTRELKRKVIRDMQQISQCISMVKSLSLLTDRQIQVLRLRSRGLTQEETAKQIKTTRENVSILESRARRNITRARITMEILEDLGVAVRVVIKPETPVLEMSNIIIKRADNANVKIKIDCIDLLERIKMRARNKIKGKKVVEAISVIVLPYGDVIVE